MHWFEQLPREMVAAIVDKLDEVSVVAFIKAYPEYAWVKACGSFDT